MIVGVVKETFPGEKRVAVVPDIAGMLVKKGHEVLVQAGAGTQAGFGDDVYTTKKATVVQDRAEVFKKAEIILQVRLLGANLEKGKSDLPLMHKDQIVIGAAEPLSEIGAAEELAKIGVTSFAMELIPRITRGQAMDILSSMATIAGYQSVLMSAVHAPKLFPMMMTAAGTIAPAKAFIIGAGVAGLQAIATSKRLGAIVSAYDVRPEVKGQIESLGGKFVEMELDADDAQDSGGYARAMGEEFYKKQREMMLRVVAESDVVITTAAVPGKKAPILITEEMVKAMPLGSVIIDLAAERGGNCELTESGKTVVKHDVTIVGPENLASTKPFHASQMWSKNITNLLMNMITKEGALEINTEDEIVRDTLMTQNGELVNERMKEVAKG